MAKVAIKNENITSFGGIYHLWTFSQSWALKDKDGRQQTDIFGKTYSFLMWTYSVAKKRSKDFTL